MVSFISVFMTGSIHRNLMYYIVFSLIYGGCDGTSGRSSASCLFFLFLLTVQSTLMGHPWSPQRTVMRVSAHF